MTINIGVAGCLGRMGQEITKKILKDKRLNFVGGFEHKNHPKLNNKICDITDIKSDLIVSSTESITSSNNLYTISEINSFSYMNESSKIFIFI